MPKLKNVAEKDVRGRQRTFDRLVTLPPCPRGYPQTRYFAEYVPLDEAALRLLQFRPMMQGRTMTVDALHRRLLTFRKNLLPFCRKGRVPAVKVFAGRQDEAHLDETTFWVDAVFFAKWERAEMMAAHQRRAGLTGLANLAIPPFDGVGYPKAVFLPEYFSLTHLVKWLIERHGAAHALALRRGLDAACHECRVPAWKLLAGNESMQQPDFSEWAIERWFVERLMQAQAE